MSRHVALLRGVNLGGRKVVMSELKRVCEDAGFEDVKTLLASGNLVLGGKLAGAKLEKRLEGVIAEGLGLKTDVYVRDAGEMAAIVNANPFAAFAKKDSSHLVVYFMRAAASEAELAAMEASGKREAWVQGRDCLYVTFPDGIGESKLKLPKVGTARNWNTVTKLAVMAAM